MSGPTGERWFVRLGSRRSGPFDLDRLRLMARRGSLTPSHALSRDGVTWSSAGALAGLFPETARSPDRLPDTQAPVEAPEQVAPVARPTRPAGARPGQAVMPLTEGGSDDGWPVEPAIVRRPGRRQVSATAAVVAAVLASSVALVLPTGMREDGTSTWWWSDGIDSVIVRCAAAACMVAAAVTAMAGSRAAWSKALAAVSLACAAASAVPMLSQCPGSAPAAVALPVIAVLIAWTSHPRPPQGVTAGSMALGALIALAALVLGAWDAVRGKPSATVLGLCVAGALLAACSGLLASLAARSLASRRHGLEAEVRVRGATSGVLAIASMGAASLAGLSSDSATRSVPAAVSACLAVCLSVVGWAELRRFVAAGRDTLPAKEGRQP